MLILYCQHLQCIYNLNTKKIYQYQKYAYFWNQWYLKLANYNSNSLVTKACKTHSSSPGYKGPVVTKACKTYSSSPGYKAPVVTNTCKTHSSSPGYKRPVVTKACKTPFVTNLI